MSDEPDWSRYSRQIRFSPVGEEGQRSLSRSRAVVVGCGALGTVMADQLARAGVSSLRLIDRDIVEFSNLQRQVLFDEDDACEGAPKAEAAARRLRKINSQIAIEAVVTDLRAPLAETLLGDADIILDGSDNFEVRFLINDFCHQRAKPWIYGGAIGAEGQTMAIVPGKTPCLRCLISDPPPPGSLPTCETAGVLASATTIIASLEVIEAIKILMGRFEAVVPGLAVVDLWNGRIRRINLDPLSREKCPACRGEGFPWLEGTRGALTTSLCGRNAVQVLPSERCEFDWEGLRRQIEKDHAVQSSPFLFRFRADDYELTVFRDGRAIIKGTDDLGIARSVYARYLGN